jgi:hypothetical protein
LGVSGDDFCQPPGHPGVWSRPPSPRAAWIPWRGWRPGGRLPRTETQLARRVILLWWRADSRRSERYKRPATKTPTVAGRLLPTLFGSHRCAHTSGSGGLRRGCVERLRLGDEGAALALSKQRPPHIAAQPRWFVGPTSLRWRDRRAGADHNREVDHPPTEPLPERARVRPRPGARGSSALPRSRRRRPHHLDMPGVRSDGVRAAAQHPLHNA